MPHPSRRTVRPADPSALASEREASTDPAGASKRPVYTPVFRLQLVRERSVLNLPRVTGPADLAPLVAAYLDGTDREHVVAVLLSSSHAVLGITTISTGTLTASLVSPREVMKVALLANAASVVVAHNHPSGSLEPSGADVHVTRLLVEAGRVMEIPVHDHLILGYDGAYTSLKERGLM